MKYYATTTNGFTIPEEVGIRYGLKSIHSQYRLVIKAKSRAAANRRWKEITGRDRDIFLPNYTSETGNKLELELCDKYGEILGLSSLGAREYSDLKDVLKAIRESNREMSNDKMIKVMYRIFDYLYASKEYAESLEDGKEDARKVYCFINTEDKDEKELDTQGVEIYDTLEEAEEVLKEWYEEV